MASLATAYQDVLQGALRDRNFMLRLRDRELGPDAIAGFVARVASRATRVALAGYDRQWHPRNAQPPEWADVLDAHVAQDDTGFHLPPDRALLPVLGGFWRHGSFQGAIPGERGLRPWYRPALVVIETTADALRGHEFPQHVLPDVAFSADLRRRKQRFFKAATRYVDERLARGAEAVYLLYQDPEWLFVLGSKHGLEQSLLALRQGFQP